jgi:hypothetical protein
MGLKAYNDFLDMQAKLIQQDFDCIVCKRHVEHSAYKSVCEACMQTGEFDRWKKEHA